MSTSRTTALRPTSSAAATLFAVAGMWMVVLGLYFSLVRPPLLPEDLAYAGTDLDRLRAAAPAVEAWLDRVFTVMGGFMSGSGVLALLAARTTSPGRWPAWGALALAGASTVGTMTVVNFAIDSDFKWLLLLPSLLWVAGLAASWPGWPGQSRLRPSR